MDIKNIFKNITPSIAVMVVGLVGAYFVYNVYFSDRVATGAAGLEPAAGEEQVVEGTEGTTDEAVAFTSGEELEFKSAGEAAEAAEGAADAAAEAAGDAEAAADAAQEAAGEAEAAADAAEDAAEAAEGASEEAPATEGSAQ